MPKIEKPRRKESQGQETPWKILSFTEIFSFYETKLLVSQKFADFLVTLKNFLVLGNFLLPIGGDSFLILPRIRCSLIRKFRT